MSRSTRLRDLLGSTAVIPVLVIDEVMGSVPVAHALYDGGLTVFEVTLRTPVAFSAIAAIATALPNAIVGAGTVLTAMDAKIAHEAGAQYAVSPGYTSALGEACMNLDLPLLPGVATPSEVMVAMNDGYDFLKFFPAEASGGTAMLRALSGPFSKVEFCPTGGIVASNARDYLALKNVRCVGGSWLTPRLEIQKRDWAHLRELAQTASRMKG